MYANFCPVVCFVGVCTITLPMNPDNSTKMCTVMQLIRVRSHQSDSTGIHWNRLYSSGIWNPLDFSCSPLQNKNTVDSRFRWNPLDSVSPSKKKREKYKSTRFLLSIDRSPKQDIHHLFADPTWPEAR
jgi:hypothetical protein